MKIQEIIIENFRSIKRLVFKVKDNYLQLIGENNSGKTNVFKAIDYFFKSSVAGINQDDFFKKDLNNQIKITVEFFDLNTNETEFFKDFLIDDKLIIKKIISMNEETGRVMSDFTINKGVPNIPHYDGKTFKDWTTNREEIISWFDEKNLRHCINNENDRCTKTSTEKGILDNTDLIKINCEIVEKEVKKPFKWKEVTKFLPEVLYIEATKKVSEEIRVTEKSKSIYKQILERIILRSLRDNANDLEAIKEFGNSLQKIETYLNKKETDDTRFEIIKKIEKEILDNLNQSILTLGVEIKIYTPQINDFFSNSDILINDGVVSSVDNKGDGLKRSLIFSLFITYAKFLREISNQDEEVDSRPFLFLIEEPELFLHPQAQKKLRDTLHIISDFDHIFYSTHSPNFVDIRHYLSIGLVKKETIEEGTTISFIEKEIFESSSKTEFNLLMRFNPERNEMFFARKVVLVEGDVERIVLTRAAELMDNDFNKENISIVECNGKGTLPYFIQILSWFNKPFIIIHDVDPLTPEESRPTEELRESGYPENEIERIKSKKRMFKKNKEIRNLIDNQFNKMGLIKINPNFEKLIGITETGDKKTYKAFKYTKSLTKEDINSPLSKIIKFILDFTLNEERSELAELEINVINSEEIEVSNNNTNSGTIQEDLKESNNTEKAQKSLNDFIKDL